MNRTYNSETGRYDPDPFVDAPLGVQIVKHRDSGDEYWVVDADGRSFSDQTGAWGGPRPWGYQWFADHHGDQASEVGWHLGTDGGGHEIVGDTTPTEAILADWELELIAQGATGYEALPADFVTNSAQYSEEFDDEFDAQHDEPIDLVPATAPDYVALAFQLVQLAAKLNPELSVLLNCNVDGNKIAPFGENFIIQDNVITGFALKIDKVSRLTGNPRAK